MTSPCAMATQSVTYNGDRKSGSTSQCAAGYSMVPPGAQFNAVCSWEEGTSSNLGKLVTSTSLTRVQTHTPEMTLPVVRLISGGKPPTTPTWTEATSSPGKCVQQAKCPTDAAAVHATFPATFVTKIDGTCTADIPITDCDAGYAPPAVGTITAKCCYSSTNNGGSGGSASWQLSSKATCGEGLTCPTHSDALHATYNPTPVSVPKIAGECSPVYSATCDAHFIGAFEAKCCYEENSHGARSRDVLDQEFVLEDAM
jgi:hypothetical protein